MAMYNMLLNEFLKEHKKVEEQQASIADLKSTVALQQKEMEVLTAQLKEQAAQIQKVSAQLEVSKPAPKRQSRISKASPAWRRSPGGRTCSAINLWKRSEIWSDSASRSGVGLAARP